MKKSIVLSVLLIAVVGLLVGAGVVAYFSDQETSSGNVFAAGTLDLKVDGYDDPSVPVYFAVYDAQPGYSGSEDITVTNAGTCDGIADIHIKNVVDEPGTTPEPEPLPDNGELSENIIISIYYNGQLVVEDTLADLNCQNFDLGPLNGNQSAPITIAWEIPAEVGNEIQGDICTFDIEFTLHQPMPE